MAAKNINISYGSYKTDSIKSKNAKKNSRKKARRHIKEEENENEPSYLSIEIIRKMLNRFLVEKEMPKEELSQVLGITRKELEEVLLFEEEAVELIPKINLTLINFYCKTFKY